MTKNLVFVHTDISAFSKILKNLNRYEDINVFSVNAEEINDFTTVINNNTSLIIIEITKSNKEIQLQIVNNLSKIIDFSSIPVLVATEELELSIQEKLIDLNVKDIIDTDIDERLLNLKIKNLLHFKETSVTLKEIEKDDLTGLYTRKAFVLKVQQLIKENPDKEFAILATDFENFKFSNSQYGEVKCNEFLAFIGNELQKYIKNGFAGRFGGDQFISAFEYSDKINIDYILQYVENGLKNAPIPHQKAKIGIYAPIDKNLPVVSCCDRAFLAISKIKGSYDKNIVFYKDEFQQNLYETQKILDSMEHALENQEFLVYYQPKHETVTGKIAGCEALVRWQHPQYGFMNPGQFIPLFEKNGFITKLDSFVLKKVCQDIKAWQKANLPIVPVSVNISRKDFLEENWMNSQLENITKDGIDNKYIHFEVTESLYAEYMDLIIEQVRKVQNNGFLIEMDDFGSGYSSLGLLATFPLNVIKLDISFVRHIDINKIVIENIIKMAHRMGLTVIAEGAESKAQYKELKTLGCDLIQGYFFSKPLPCNEYEKYLVQNGVYSENKKLTVFDTQSDSEYYNEYLMKAASEVGESVPGGFFSFHADGNHEIISFNEEILKIFDCDSPAEFREFTGNSFKGMVQPKEWSRLKREINNQLKNESDISHLKFNIVTKKHNIKYVDDYSRLVYSKKYGNVFFVFINDITQIHAQHLEVEKRNEVIQGLSRNYKSIYLIEFEKNQLIPYAISDEYKDFMAYIMNSEMTYDEIVSCFADRYVIESERKKIKSVSTIKSIQKQFLKDDFYSFTFHLEKDGVISLTELAFMKLKGQNESSKAVLTFRSVSEDMINVELERNNELLKQLEIHKKKEIEDEVELKKAYDLVDTANRISSILMNHYSLDTNILLNEVNGLSKKALECKDLSEIKNYIQKISDNTERVFRMVDNLKTTVKIITGSLEKENLAATDCSAAIEKYLLNIKEYVSRKNITVNTFYNMNNPYIYQDLDKTAFITLNVLMNAIKYTPEGGTITFGINQYEGKTSDECIVEFICRDSGIGISEDFQKKLFTPFLREDNEINNNIPGPGLGLYASQKLLKQNGGSIEIKSIPGKGTEVRVFKTHKLAKPSDIL